MTLLQKYKLRIVENISPRKDDLAAGRCPVCKYPMYNGAQLICEPAICMYRELPERYATVVSRDNVV